jgi:hypothetical protein
VDGEYYVYEWFIKDTNEVFYVGKGKGNRYKETKSRNKFFLDMYKTHSCDVRKVFDGLTEKEAFAKEVELIAYYRKNTTFRLTNQTDGGEGSSGWRPDNTFKKKQSVIHKQQWQDDEFRQRMMQIRSDENGPYKSKEFRNKIASLVSGKDNPNYAHYWTQEMKDHLSKVRKQNGKSAGTNNVKATKIICLENGEVFDLIKYAMEKYNVKCEGSFTVALKNRYKTAAGLHWMIYEDRLLDESERIKELIYSLSLNPSKNPMICLQTNETFNTRNDFRKKYNISESKFRWEYNKNKMITIDSYNYVYIKDYLDYIFEDDGVAV